MKKVMRGIAAGILVLGLMTMIGCDKQSPKLKGFYQSDWIGSEVVQISFDEETQSFTEYITNREVNQGSFKQQQDGTYLVDGDELDFTIQLNQDNTFEVWLPKLNGDTPILMKNISSIPGSFKTGFEDEADYKAYIK